MEILIIPVIWSSHFVWRNGDDPHRGAFMSKPVSIAGGNIAGLSAAYHLARKGCPVTVYEAKIWDKPCGGAVSLAFADYLEKVFGIHIKTADPLPRVKFGFQNGRCVETEGLFIIMSRYDLQKKLIECIGNQPDVNIQFEQLSTKKQDLFSPQTVLATGFSGFTRQVLQDHWHRQEHALALKFEGILDKASRIGAHLIVFDSRYQGYGWVFLKGKDRYNIGIGGITKKTDLHRRFDAFVGFIEKRFNCRIEPPPVPPRIWKIPMVMDSWKAPVSFLRNRIEFIGTGDALGLAHPVIGAGIEPAWQSGWLLGESYDPSSQRIDTVKYRRLLKKNQQLTSRKPIDRFVSRMLRNPSIPYKDGLSFFLLKLFKRPTIHALKKYPWFALVHDGRRKTGFTSPSR